MDRADLDYLINGIVNGLGGANGISIGGRSSSTAVSSFSKSVGGEHFTIDDFEKRMKKYNKALNGEEYRDRDEISNDIIENEERIAELSKEVNDILYERNKLVDKINKGDGT